MNEHKAVGDYFQKMASVANELAAVPALILEQGYSHGSWWFAFKKAGWRYRLVFDGRDRSLTVESGGRAGGGAIPEWTLVTSQQLSVDAQEPSVAEVVKIIQEVKRNEEPAV